MKYEFKDIKDVDLSKLEDDRKYLVYFESTADTSLYEGYYIKLYPNEFKSIILPLHESLQSEIPCSPIETDKLRDELKTRFLRLIQDLHFSLFKQEDTTNKCNELIEMYENAISGSKEVEVSDEDIELEANNYNEKFEIDTIRDCIRNLAFITGAKWMRDKQGIAPKEVVTPTNKCIEEWWAQENVNSAKFWKDAPYRTNVDVIEEIKTAVQFFTGKWQRGVSVEVKCI